MNTEATKKIISVIVIAVLVVIIGMLYANKQVDKAIEAAPVQADAPNVPTTVTTVETGAPATETVVPPMTEPVKLEAATPEAGK